MAKGALARAKDNWKWLLVAFAFLTNSPVANRILEQTTGWSLSGKLQAAAPAPVEEMGPAYGGSGWKKTVERRLQEMEKGLKTVAGQNKRILEILEAE
jgi:hypothetical protein